MNKFLALVLLLSPADALKLRANGIFDKVVDKMQEKERALAQYEFEHEKNLVKA